MRTATLVSKVEAYAWQGGQVQEALPWVETLDRHIINVTLRNISRGMNW